MMRASSTLGAAVAVGLLAACDAAISPEPLDARLVASDVWSGGDVTLVSEAFVPPGRLPLVRIDAETLVVRRIDDSTVAARLPDGNGPRTVSVEATGFLPATAQVVLHGFRSSEDGPFLSGFLQPLPGQPSVLGAGDTGLVEVDVRGGAVLREWPSTVHSPDCIQGVGPSVRPGHYVFFGKDPAGGCTHPWVWQYGPELVRADSIWALELHWAVAELGPGGSIAGGDDHLYISRCDAAGCSNPLLYSNYGGSITGSTIGPTARRAVLHQWNRFVVHAATGDTLYRLPLRASDRVEGAAFSAGEDTLYAVGHAGQPSDSRLVMVAAADGALLDSVSLAGVSAFDVARDPVRPWLYVAAVAGDIYTDGPPLLIVLEQGTLAPVAVLRAPASETLSLTAWHQFRIVQDAAMNAVHVVATKQLYQAHGVRAKILRFDVLP